MAEVAIHLRCLSPRWLLASRPHVVVNQSAPVPLTKTPVSFEVPAGRVLILVAPFRASAEMVVHDRRLEHTRYESWADDADVLRLYYRPTLLLGSSWHLRGRIRPVGSAVFDS